MAGPESGPAFFFERRDDAEGHHDQSTIKLTPPAGQKRDVSLVLTRRRRVKDFRRGMIKEPELLFGHYRIFHAFTNAELERCFGRYLDRIASLWVAALARFTLREH